MQHRIIALTSAAIRAAGVTLGGVPIIVDSPTSVIPPTTTTITTTTSRDVSTSAFLDRIAQCRLVFFGEIHSVPSIVNLQSLALERMAAEAAKLEDPQDAQTKSGTLHVIFEHFSFEMQELLDAYSKDDSSCDAFDTLVQRYRAIGTEGHDLAPYAPLLALSKRLPNVRLHAGFLPRTYARMLMQTRDPAATFQAARHWFERNAASDTAERLPNASSIGGTLQTSAFHYKLFTSMITGRNVHDEPDDDDDIDRFRPLFQAQLLKDVAMAHKVSSLMTTSSSPRDKFLVLTGNGHVAYYHGVPERVLQDHPDASCLVVTSHVCDGTTSGDEQQQQKTLQQYNASQLVTKDLPPGTQPTDVVIVFAPPASPPRDL